MPGAAPDTVRAARVDLPSHSPAEDDHEEAHDRSAGNLSQCRETNFRRYGRHPTPKHETHIRRAGSPLAARGAVLRAGGTVRQRQRPARSAGQRHARQPGNRHLRRALHARLAQPVSVVPAPGAEKRRGDSRVRRAVDALAQHRRPGHRRAVRPIRPRPDPLHVQFPAPRVRDGAVGRAGAHAQPPHDAGPATGMARGHERYLRRRRQRRGAEEIDQGVAGGNYGWPDSEGYTTNPQFQSPVYAYAHGTRPHQGFAIVGAAFYNPPTATFPSQYVGKYFFADFVNGWISYVDPGAPNLKTPTIFATNIPVRFDGVPVDLEVGADGALYYLDRFGGGVFMIQFTAATQAP